MSEEFERAGMPGGLEPGSDPGGTGLSAAAGNADCPSAGGAPSSAEGHALEAAARSEIPEGAYEEPREAEPRGPGDPSEIPNLSSRPRGRRLAKKSEGERKHLSAEQRLLILDTWKRSGLPAGDFSELVGLSPHTLYLWRAKFQSEGPGGLVPKPKGGPRGSRLSDLTRRTILMLKESNPEFGSERISDLLRRGPALAASPGAVATVLRDAGYELEEAPTRPHGEEPRRFERARPGELWQTDLFTFVLKRQNRRVYLVAFLDDHSRFLVGYGLHATQSSSLVIEALRSAIASYSAPEEILTDNGSQYITWRGKSAFARECEKRGIRQIVASPRRPQTLGKIERFWGTLWRECLEGAVFLDLPDANRRIGHFCDHYNFQRPHRALEGLVPADRFFSASGEVLRALRGRVAANALELAREGLPRPPFYLAGNAGGNAFSVHAEGERVILTPENGEREEITLARPSESLPRELPAPLCPSAPLLEESAEEPQAPGASPLDDAMRRLAEGLAGEGGEG
jgi:transposase InsO family protein